MRSEYLRVFRALSDERRLRVLELLRDGEKCACILLDDLNISQSTLSHHMKILCASGIVAGRPVGKWVYYSISDAGCDHAKELLTKLTENKAAQSGSLLMLLLKSIAYPFRYIIRLYFMHIISKYLDMMNDESEIVARKKCGCKCSLTAI